MTPAHLPSMRRRTLLGAGAASAGALALAACSSDKSSDSSSGGGGGAKVDFSKRGPITLAKGKDTTGKLRETIDAWNKEHPDEKVTFVELPESADDQRAQLINNAQAKSDAYDVLGLDVVWTAEFAANQWVVELPKDKFPLDKLIPATVATGTYFDKLYAVPWTTNAQLLFSRKDLLEKAGYTEPPKSFEEMYEAIDKIKKADSSNKGFGSQYAKYEGLTCQVTGVVASAGGQLFDDKGQPKADSAEAIKGVQTIKDGFDKGYIPKEALTFKEEESRQAFQDGSLAFLQNWPYVYEKFNATDGSSKVSGKVLVSTLPGIGGKDGRTALGGLNYGISAFGKNAGTAVDFISFMVSDEQLKKYVLAAGDAPANESLYTDEEITKKYPYFDDLKKAIDTGVSRPQVVKYGDVTQAIQEAAYGINSGAKEVDPTVKELQKQLTDLTAKK